MGYYLAGFRVVGVDNRPQKNYPFEFIQADALEYVAEHGHEYDAIHASPPCQWISVAAVVHRNNGKVYPELIQATRFVLSCLCLPYVIENVPPAKPYLYDPVALCGVQFGLGVLRHRLFECSFSVEQPPHLKHDGKIGDGRYFSVAGGAGRWKSWGTVYRNVSKGTRDEWRRAMGIDWMNRQELTQAIPPAYTEFIGKQLMAAL